VNPKGLTSTLIVATQTLKLLSVAVTLLPRKIATNEYLHIIIKTCVMCSAEVNDHNICSTTKDSHDNTQHAIPISFVFCTHLFL